ncbi:MAG: cell division protein FtsA [Candidatus Omnitrophica bacterium]|nr:cell division protein FtsA [Candidatus Omnitrophota bacterium]
MKKRNIYVLYVGTTKLVALQGWVCEDGSLTVERFVKMPSVGFERGVVVNIEKASMQFRKLVNELGGTVDYTKVDFYVVISNEYLRNYSCNSSLYFGELMKPITQSDIHKVIAQTKSVSTIPLDEYIIEQSPQEFLVNDLGNIIDPLELEARRLGVNLLIFTVDGTVIRNLTKALERADLTATSFIPKALASCFAVLREEEKRDGVVLVDMGGYVTDILYVKNMIIQHYETKSVGGEDISSYLAEHLSITQPEAQRLKERFGSAMLLSTFEDEIIPVVDIFGKTRLSLNKKRLYDQIFTSTKDLLEKIKPAIDGIKKKIGVVAGIVLTGGSVSLEGLLELSQDVFATPVRLGVTRKIHGPKEVVTSPQYTAAAGVLGYVQDQYRKNELQFRNKSYLMKETMKVKAWIQKYF